MLAETPAIEDRVLPGAAPDRAAGGGLSADRPLEDPCAEVQPGPAQPAPGEIDALMPRRVPSERNRTIYRLVKLLHRSERDVAAQYDLSQPRVHAICKQVKRWLKTGEGDLDGCSEEEKLHLCTNHARMRLSAVYGLAARYLEVTGQPSVVKRMKFHGEETPHIETVDKGPNPKPAFLGYMLRAAIELAKVEGVYDPRPKSPASQQGSGFGVQDSAQGAGAGGQQSGAVPPSDPPSELLSPSAEQRAAAEQEIRDKKDIKRLRADGCTDEMIANVARRKTFKAQKKRYRALAAACGLRENDRDLFEDLVIDLEMAAEDADGFARERLSAEAQVHGELTEDQQHQRLAQYRRHFLQNLIEADFYFVDEARSAVLARYQPDTGRFEWWMGDVEELAAIVLEEDDGLDDQDEPGDETDDGEPDEELDEPDDQDELDEEDEELDDEAQEERSAAWDSQPRAPAGRYRQSK